MTHVTALTVEQPSVTSCYVLQRLLDQNLLSSLVIVRPEPWKWKLRQSWRIGRRQGAGRVLSRFWAARLRSRLLSDYRRRHMVRPLFPDGTPCFPAVPADIPVIRACSLDSPQTQKIVADLQADLGVQAGAGWIREPLLSVPRLGFVSLHHGVMPLIRGMDSILWAHLENRKDWMGITVQKLGEGLDAGEVLAQASVPPREGENPYQVIARATEIGAQLMSRTIRDLLQDGPASLPAAQTAGVYRSSLTPQAVRRLHRMMSRIEDLEAASRPT